MDLAGCIIIGAGWGRAGVSTFSSYCTAYRLADAARCYALERKGAEIRGMEVSYMYWYDRHVTP